MSLNAIRFISLLFTSLALVPAGAHLLELPSKIRLSREDYRTVRQIYRVLGMVEDIGETRDLAAVDVRVPSCRGI